MGESIIFRQKTNKENDIKATLDGYAKVIDHQFWLAEALQKDSIQNSWDARINKNNAEGWECKFLVQRIGKDIFLTITDKGTNGLTGTKFESQEELDEILLSNDPSENLAYFCNSNWSAKSEEEGGTRGRGKVIFLGASKDKKIYFDSLRKSDNKYVFCELYLDKDKEIKYTLKWDDIAKNKLEEITHKVFEPLVEHGTRIIILNPEAKIIESIKNGNFLLFINNTWWEILKKFDAKIIVNDGFCTKNAILPFWYGEKGDNIIEKIFSDEIIGNKYPNYKVKKMALRYSADKDIPETLKGIAIQRGGMTIERIRTEEFVKEEGMHKVFGWVEMDKELNNEIKNKCEGPEHFCFTWSKKPIIYLKDYIKNRTRKMAKDLELIESEQSKKNKVQKLAVYKTIRNLTPLFKKLDIYSHGRGPRPSRDSSDRKPNEPLRLSCPDFLLPNKNNRVNYGQIIKGVYVKPVNETDNKLKVLIRIYIESESGIKYTIDESIINLEVGVGSNIGRESIKINEDFDKGGYSLRAQMIFVEDLKRKIKINDEEKIFEKGYIIYDRINKKFYIETNPPERGLFDFQPKSSENKKQLLAHEKNEDSYIFYYNDKHPKIKLLLDNKDDNLERYLTEQGALLIYQIKLEEMIAEDEYNSDKELGTIIKTKRLDNVIPILSERLSEFLWEFYK